jgi:hypothetical protein
VAGSCGYGNESSGSVKDGEFLGHLSDCHLLKQDFASFKHVHKLLDVLL